MKTKVVTGILVLAVVAAAIGVVAARNNFGMQPPAMDHQWSSGSRWMNQLTEEQRQEVIQQMQEFKQQTCDQYNITCPSGPMSHLTEEERQEVRQKIQEFRQGQRQEVQEFMQQIGDQRTTSPVQAALNLWMKMAMVSAIIRAHTEGDIGVDMDLYG